MIQPFTPSEIVAARNVPVQAVLEHLGAYVKRDEIYKPLDTARHSVRLQINYQQKDFRLIFTGEKFVNELLPKDDPNRGGGGAIDLVKHITGMGFLPAVKVCLEVVETLGGVRR
jgi:hypothetical protein